MNARFIAVVLFAIASGCTEVKAPPPPAAARVVSFSADKTQIAAGETVTLSFRTENATEVQVLDDAGRFIDLAGETAQGSAVVAPARSTFYIVRANGPGGRDTAFVQVAVGEPVRDIFLLAVPAQIESGDSAQLLWGAAGATGVTLQTGETTPVALTGGTGTVVVNPARSERYTLTATNGDNQPTVTALTEVRVRPKLLAINLEAPNGLEAGRPISVTWSARGAQRVVVRERSFGQLAEVTAPAMLDEGSASWTIPNTLPTGLPLQSGVPLRFEVTISSNAGSANATIAGVVGDAPLIERVTAPSEATAGQSFTISWNTVGAAKVGIEISGAVVFETLPSERDRAAAGSVSLPAPAAATDYTVVATNERGVAARRTISVRPVALPVINSFTLTPPVINAAGDSVTAQWSTSGAQRIQLRVPNGPTIALNTTTPNNGSISFRAAADQTFVLEAFNAAGDSATATASLRSLGASPVTITPSPTSTGNTVTLSWALAALGVTEVVGLPTPASSVIAVSTNFVDLTQDPAAIDLIFTDGADGSAQVVQPPGFHFTLLGVERRSLWVSVNGFLSFARPAALNENLALADVSVPSLIAPFWDDLSLGPNSRVLTGFAQPLSTGERRFVIQWHRLLLGAAELSFEVQLTETGAVTFVYGDLGGENGDAATIGVKEATQNVVQQTSFNGTVSVADLNEFNFFSLAPATSSLSFIAEGSRTIGFSGRTASGVIPLSATLVALRPGDLRISEAMPSPDVSVVTSGQWLEIENTTDVAIDLDGLTLRSTGSTTGHAFAGVTVPARGFVVLGQSVNPVDNGGAGVTVLLDDVPLSDQADTVQLLLGGDLIDTLSWTGATHARSVFLSPGYITSSGGPLSTFCLTASQTFGPSGAIGTPGARNEKCHPYVLQPIPGQFVDISAGGTELIATASDYTGIGVVDLPVPFTYFGQSYSSFSVSIAGFITFGPPITEAWDTLNATVPTTAAPNGVVAPFWDQITRNTNGHLWLRRDADRTIVSWQDFRIYATTSEMHLQVHLIDTGVIEFHYGTMIMTSTAAASLQKMRGSTATVWIEDPAGGQAIAAGINTVGTVLPDTGYRFTP